MLFRIRSATEDSDIQYNVELNMINDIPDREFSVQSLLGQK